MAGGFPDSFLFSRLLCLPNFLIRDGNRHQMTTQANECFRLMKELLVMGKLIFGQGRKVLLAQTDNQHISSGDVVDLAILRSQCPIQRQLAEFTLFVDDDCGFVLPRINGLILFLNKTFQIIAVI